MTGTDAFHPGTDTPRAARLPVRADGLWWRAAWWLSLACVLPCLGELLCPLLPGKNAASFTVGSTRLLAADISFPNASPFHTINVQAESLARQVRGSYDVLAFRGGCTLRQGELSATCRELILWIDRAPPSDPSQPRKFICTMEGGVQLQWDGKPLLSDERWMGHLFSFQDVALSVRGEESRDDIPRLDWSRDPASAVAQAQFATPPAGPPSASTAAAPPLLPQTQGSFPGAAQTQMQPQAQMPAQTQNILPPPTGGAPGTLQLNPPRVQSLPGAVQWPAQNAPNGSSLLPPSGLVIPDDGSSPYPAAGLPAPATPPVPGAGAPQFPGGAPPPYTAAQPTVALPGTGIGIKNVQFRPRNNTRGPTVKFHARPEYGDTVATLTGGIIISISGVQVQQPDGSVMDFGTVSIETDNAVAWISGTTQPDLWTGLQSFADRPIELYLEGNIVLHQGQRLIYAERMYYNVSSEYGMVLSAEVLTPVPQYQGLVRLKADVLEQRNRQNFLAYGAAVTSSRLGVPRYWMQADRVQLQDTRPEESIDNSRPPGLSQPTNMLATSRNNFVYLAGVPVTYWPVFTTNLAKPTYYLTGVKFKNDQIFGTQVYADWDLYQLTGIKPIDGTDWTLSTDYLSKRGPAAGTRFTMDKPSFLFSGPTAGYLDAWFIQDHGLDRLGADRQNLVPEATTRGRAVGRFRSLLTPNTELWSELGYISDRNFLEQYFENEWDQQKDYDTALRLRQYNGNRMFDLWGKVRLNDFFTDTEWLPRADHYWLGQDLGEYLTWSEHTSVGYGHQRIATVPTDPRDAATFTYLPWETDSEGLRAITRQEINAPFDLGAWKIIPFASGEAAYWGEDLTGNPLTRLTGQGGVRTALPFWRADPSYRSELFDINGMAHKVTLQSELFYADSTQDISRLPLYDPLDDNSQEHFRRRMIFNTFGGNRPLRFDERNYALRQGMQRYVTANSMEIVDDMAQVRMGVDQRWQTKRGAPGRERIVDLVTLDVDWIYFPKAQRDNFGEDVGAVNYDFRYNIGDRLALLSDGYFDVFSQGLKAVSAGAMISRPGRGEAYLGMLSLEGPISSNVLNGYVNYQLTEKWIATGGAAWDFSDVGSVGQTFMLTRIGESALVQVGMNVDSGRNNVSFNFNIEPRFLPGGRLGTVGGQSIAPAGLYGVE
ncbi:MAG: organic solvent tolerance protein OstA [Aureliella sp.]